MPKIVAGLMAMIALGGSILMEVDAITTIIRGMVAFLVGMVATALWGTFFGNQPSSGTQTSNSDETGEEQEPEGTEVSPKKEESEKPQPKPQNEKQAAA
jgi:cytoskeletal protein RodZ